MNPLEVTVLVMASLYVCICIHLLGWFEGLAVSLASLSILVLFAWLLVTLFSVAGAA